MIFGDGANDETPAVSGDDGAQLFVMAFNPFVLAARHVRFPFHERKPLGFLDVAPVFLRVVPLHKHVVVQRDVLFSKPWKNAFSV